MLPGAHMKKLRFFKVSRYPEIADLGDRKQLLTAIDTRADLGKTFHYNSSDRGNNFVIAEVQLSLFKKRFSSLEVCDLLLHGSMANRQLWRGILLILDELAAGLVQLSLPLVDRACSGENRRLDRLKNGCLLFGIRAVLGEIAL